MSETWKIALKWGAIGSIGAAALGLVLYLLNVDSSSFLNYLSLAILIAVLIFGGYEFRDKINGGFASFQEIFRLASMIVLVFALISSVWSIVYMEVIDTNLVNEILLKTELDMEEKGLDDEIIQQTLAVTKKMMKPHFFFITGFLFIMFFGELAAVLVSLVMKKDKPEELIIDENITPQ